jgi:hypothetical protein
VEVKCFLCVSVEGHDKLCYLSQMSERFKIGRSKRPKLNRKYRSIDVNYCKRDYRMYENKT